jgi:SAM-dependent methyltransferase
MISSKIYEKWMKENQEKKIKEILREIEMKGRILDIGCGPGFLGKDLDNIISIDIDLENLKKTKRLKVLGSGDFLPFKSEKFQTIFCIDTIHLLKNGENEIKKVLSKDGIAIISTFCNKYNKEEKMNWLKEIFRNWKIEKEFIVGEKELDAVAFLRKI